MGGRASRRVGLDRGKGRNLSRDHAPGFAAGYFARAPLMAIAVERGEIEEGIIQVHAMLEDGQPPPTRLE